MPSKANLKALLQKQAKTKDSLKGIQTKIAQARNASFASIGKEVAKHHAAGWKEFQLDKLKAFVLAKLGDK
jgi:hypothetical protein